MNAGIAHIKFQQQHALAGQGERDGQVEAHETLTLSGHGGGDQDGPYGCPTSDELQIRPDQPEHLGDDGPALSGDGHRMFAIVVIDQSQQRNPGVLADIIHVSHPGVECLQQTDQQDREHKATTNAQGPDISSHGGHLSEGTGRFDDLIV